MHAAVFHPCGDMRKSPSSRPIQDFAKEGLMPDQTPANALMLDVKRAGNTVVVKCDGKLVAGVNDILYARVSRLIPDSKRIVLDLTNLTRVDSMGLGTLVRLYVSARSAGCSLELVNLGKQVRQLLGTTGLMSVFVIIGEHGIKMG